MSESMADVWKRACREAEAERDDALRLNGEYKAALEQIANPRPRSGHWSEKVAQMALSEKQIQAPKICMVQTGCMGGVCGKLLPCDDHKPLHEQCWCAAKAEAKDAICPLHG